jgi:hypothetical protein
VDRAFNDNVYAESDPDYLAQDGWPTPPGHTFKALERSDGAQFDITYPGGSYPDLGLDYLNKGSQPGQYASGELGDNYGDGPMAPINAAATSLHWNLLNSGWDGGPWGDPLDHSPPYTTTLPWEWHMIYEFSIPKSQMSGECGDVDQAGAHSSPGKDDESTGKIGDRVWEDNNLDGNQDAGEDGLPGVTVDLYQGSTKIRTTETEPGVSGYYIFNNLEAGTYRVDVDESTLPPDYVLTSNNEPMTVTIAAGEVFTDADFGYYLQGDAKIELDPLQAANQVGDEHVIMAYVDVHDGTVWGPAPNGTTVIFSLQNNTAEAYFVGGINTCLTSGGSCSVTINGNVSGSVDIHALTDVSVGGLVLHRETDGTGSNSGDAQKIYVVMDYEISKTLNGPDAVGVGHAVSFTIRITNTGDTTITVLPLADVYSTTYLTYGYTDTVSTWADPDSDDHNDDGEINWSDLTLTQGDLAPSASFTVIVTFTAKADTTVLQPDGKTENTAIVDGAKADPDGGGPLPEEELPQKQDGDRVQIIVPTGVVLGSLNAVAQPDGVLISWQTANEVRILGFDVLWRGLGGELEQVGKEFIFAEYAGADRGSDYACLDKGVVSGRTYDYVLEAIMSDGRVERYDVPAVTARWWLKLPLLLAR